jgi:hypothetical protein
MAEDRHTTLSGTPTTRKSDMRAERTHKAHPPLHASSVRQSLRRWMAAARVVDAAFAIGAAHLAVSCAHLLARLVALLGPHRRVQPAAALEREQRLVRATLDRHAVPQDDDLVAAHHRREPVRDRHRAAAGARSVEGVLHLALRLCVEGARRFVEDEHRRLTQQRTPVQARLDRAGLRVRVSSGAASSQRTARGSPRTEVDGSSTSDGRNPEALLLTAAQPQAALTHRRLKAVLEARDVAVHAREAQRVRDLVGGRIRGAVRQVEAHLV